MSVFDSIKNAGSSAFGVAKDFGGRFKEERQNQAQSAQADRIARAADEAGMGDGTAKEESFLDRVTSTAKNIGESVSSAARETRNSESFEKAREDFTTAFNETREGVQGAINNAKEQRAEGKHAQQPQEPQSPRNPYAQKPNDDVIDGEVVDEN
ncbi:hypothetical protein WU87_04725 [Corynebacterium minutissimum]|uniref:Uncharacterized protein n=1 Tax=Corynebacterium minutissimum TaxID=38301 RepID=A0ACC4UBT1_9CORY|nr:hypothetical protein WU87_04725 [Corynebacterium minutissimum]